MFICFFCVQMSPTLTTTNVVSFCVISLKISLFYLRLLYDNIELFGYLNLHNNRRLRLVQNSFGQHIKYTVNAITDDNGSKYLICSILNQSRTRSNRFVQFIVHNVMSIPSAYILLVFANVFLFLCTSLEWFSDIRGRRFHHETRQN